MSKSLWHYKIKKEFKFILFVNMETDIASMNESLPFCISLVIWAYMFCNTIMDVWNVANIFDRLLTSCSQKCFSLFWNFILFSYFVVVWVMVRSCEIWCDFRCLDLVLLPWHLLAYDSPCLFECHSINPKFQNIDICVYHCKRFH